MRLRNIKNAKEILNNSKYILNEPKKYKGKLNELFRNDNEIHLEIGCGRGKFILENAIKYKDINFIGIEKYDSVLARAVKKVEEYDIPNLKLIRMDAVDLESVFDKDIDLIYLNFSDPWPKHEKRRLTYNSFLDIYDKIYKGNGNIIMKTDNRNLFEYSIKSISSNGYKIKDIFLDLHNSNIPNIITTEYEEKFISMGNIIYRMDIYKDVKLK